MEYRIRIMGIPELNVFQTHTRKVLRKIEDSPKDIVSLLEEIWFHERVRSKSVVS